MKRSEFAFFLVVLFSFSLFSQKTDPKQTAITVYNSNIAVVKDTRSLNLPKGNSIANLIDVAQLIDPTTVRIKFNGEVLEQNYQYDLVSMDKILKRYIDKDIQLISEKGELLEGTLLSVYGNQVVLKKKDVGLTMLPDVSKYRFGVGELPEGLITKPTLQCFLNAEKAGQQDVELSYQTSGVSWHAEYVAVLDAKDKEIDLNSWVSVQNNCGTTFKDAQLKLVAGDVNIVQPKRNAGYMADYAVMAKTTTQQFTEKGLFEYHLYNLERKTTLSNNETKQISLFEKQGVKVDKKFRYDAIESGGDQEDKVSVVIQFENKESNNLGVPMPKGKVRIFKSEGNSLEFIGEDEIDHTSRDERVTLNIGSAFDIKAKTVQVDYKKITEKVYETTYKVTVKNHKDEAVNVEVKKDVGLLWTMKETSLDYKKENASTILFNVAVPARADKDFTFTIRYQY